MQTRIETLEIENQKVMLELNFYSDNDILVLSSIYKKWVQLSDLIQENGGRRINIPELLSEAIFCTAKGGRLNKTKNGKINSLLIVSLFLQQKVIQIL